MPKTNAEKLQVKPGNAVLLKALDRAVTDEERTLILPLPDDAAETDKYEADVAVLSAYGQDDVDRLFAEELPKLTGVRAMWVAYRKGRKDGITRDTMWQNLRDAGWDANSMVSLSDTFSALRAKPLDE